MRSGGPFGGLRGGGRCGRLLTAPSEASSSRAEAACLMAGFGDAHREAMMQLVVWRCMTRRQGVNQGSGQDFTHTNAVVPAWFLQDRGFLTSDTSQSQPQSCRHPFLRLLSAASPSCLGAQDFLSNRLSARFAQPHTHHTVTPSLASHDSCCVVQTAQSTPITACTTEWGLQYLSQHVLAWTTVGRPPFLLSDRETLSSAPEPTGGVQYKA